MAVPNDGSFSRKVGLLISYYITLSFWSAQTLCLSMVSKNIAGQTKKSTVIACTFVSWAVGNAIGKSHSYQSRLVTNRESVGPQVFLGWDAPTYHIAFGVHLACYSIMTMCVIFLRFYLLRQNKKREAMLQAAGGADPNLLHAFEDRTDRENLNFRYCY